LVEAVAAEAALGGSVVALLVAAEQVAAGRYCP
jgi:hypothetical protein